MGDSSSDESISDWILYAERTEWKDITPIPQNEGPFPVVAITYPERYRDVYDYFRAVVAKGERSERVLDLCADAIMLNPAHYTVWQYRRSVLQAINYDLHREIEFLDVVIENNPKNYQVWHHRRVIVEWLSNDSTNELSFTKTILNLDAKNYHAWQHRQWYLMKYNLFDSNELDYINELLEKDVRNNSAWNHRYFYFNFGKEGFSSETIDQEIQYVMEALSLATNNESAWNYLRGLLFHCDEGLNKPQVIKFCEGLCETEWRSRHAVSFLADAAVEFIEKNQDVEKNMEIAVKLYQDLAVKYDTMRASYWCYLSDDLKARYNHSNKI